MKKIAFVFPGQGAQYVGMGKDFYEQIPECREVFSVASKVTGLDLPKLCFEENEELHITEYTQIAMLTVEAAILEALKKRGMISDVNAGLSLGEYGALIASGVFEMADAFRVVRQRGIFMQKAVPCGGAMTAVLGLDAEKIEQICGKTDGVVSVANYNCPGQTVITGKEDAVNRAAQMMKEAGARRCIPLKVSGPFHSAMLRSAGDSLGEVLDAVTIHEIKIPYITNVTADYVKDRSEVKNLLKRQVSSSVLWQQSMERMIKDGVDTFVEIGPGKTLSGFLKKIDRSVTTMNVEKIEDFEKVIAVWQKEGRL